MPCFGGPDLRTLFVTSLRRLDGGAQEPGTLISLDVGVAGLPSNIFGVPAAIDDPSEASPNTFPEL